MGQGKILIVDDETAMRSALRRALRHRDHTIITASDGEEALAAFDRNAIGEVAVAVVDLYMPGMDGVQVLSAIKRRSPQTQVLMLTGHATIPNAVRAMRQGADDFLEKPFVPDVLRERVRTAVRVWSARHIPGTDGEQPGASKLTGILLRLGADATPSPNGSPAWRE